MQEIQRKSRTTRIEDSIETVPGYPVQIYLIPASSHRNARGEWEGIYQARTVGRMNGTRPRASAYSAEVDRLFRRNVTGDSAESAPQLISTRIGHVQSRLGYQTRFCRVSGRSSGTGPTDV